MLQSLGPSRPGRAASWSGVVPAHRQIPRRADQATLLTWTIVDQASQRPISRTGVRGGRRCPLGPSMSVALSRLFSTHHFDAWQAHSRKRSRSTSRDLALCHRHLIFSLPSTRAGQGRGIRRTMSRLPFVLTRTELTPGMRGHMRFLRGRPILGRRSRSTSRSARALSLCIPSSWPGPYLLLFMHGRLSTCGAGSREI